MNSSNGTLLLALGIAILAGIQGVIAMPTRIQPLTLVDETKPVHELNALDQNVYLKNPYLELDSNIQTDNTIPGTAPGEIIEESEELENNEENKGRDQLPPLILARQPLKDLLADFFDKLDNEREFREILLNPVNREFESPLELVLPSRPAQKPLLTPSKIEDQVIFKDEDKSNEIIKDDSNEYDDYEESPPVNMFSEESNEQPQGQNKEKASSDENLLNDAIDTEKENQNNVDDNESEVFKETDIQIAIADVDSNPEADEPPNEDEVPSKLGLDDEMSQDEDFEIKPLAVPGTNLDIIDVDPNPEADKPPNEDEDPSKLGLDDEMTQDEDFELKPPAVPGTNLDIIDVDSNPEAEEPPNEDEDPSKLGLDDEMSQDEDFELKPPAIPGSNLDIIDVDTNPEADEPPNEDEDPSKLGLDDEMSQDEDFELKPPAIPGTNLDIIDVDPNPEADEPPNEDEDPSKLGLDDDMTQDEDFVLKPPAIPGTNLDIIDVDPNPEADEPPNEDEDPSKLGLDDAPVENQTIPDTEQTFGSKEDENSEILKETDLKPFLGVPDKLSQNQHLYPDRIIFPLGDLF